MSNKVFILKSNDGKPLRLDSASDVEPYIVSLKGNTDVEEIRLGGNTLGIEACRALGGVLESNINLKIFIADDIFTGRLISEIPDALTALLQPLLSLPHLHAIDLSDNAFGGRLAEPLQDFYARAGLLRHLLLNNNGLASAKIIISSLTSWRLGRSGRLGRAGEKMCLRGGTDDDPAPPRHSWRLDNALPLTP